VKTDTNPHEGLRVSLILTLVGGFLDAYTYLLMGGVFANAQTGNVVLLALSLLDIPKTTFFKFLLPILAFLVGVMISELVRANRSLQERSRWAVVVVAFEVVVLALVGVFAGVLFPSTVNCVISLIAGLQASSFKKVRNSPFATTMVTGNLRSATELAVQFLLKKSPGAHWQALTYLLVVGVFIAGAALGALAASTLSYASIILCCGLLAVVGLLLLRKKP